MALSAASLLDPLLSLYLMKPKPLLLPSWFNGMIYSRSACGLGRKLEPKNFYSMGSKLHMVIGLTHNLLDITKLLKMLAQTQFGCLPRNASVVA